jgi:hypothetical protein
MTSALALAFVLVTSSLAVAPTKATRSVYADLVQPRAALESQRARLWNAASPELRTKLEPAIERVLVSAGAKPKDGEAPLDLLAEAKDAATAVLGSRSAADIEAMAFVIMMQAAKSAREDLEAIMGAVKAIDMARACKGAKPCLDALAPKDEVTQAHLDALRSRLAAKETSLSEMGEMESLRLQMAMDRMSKMMSTLSNLLKKISDTSSAIVQNIK